MPTILSHPAVPMALALARRSKLPIRLLGAAVAASMLPDADVLGLRLGVPYGHAFGHRGFSHSIVFALLVGLVGLASAPRLHSSRRTAFLVLFASTLSHGFLDAFTDGGLGVAFLSPVSHRRFFFPWRPIVVAPLSPSSFFSRWGLEVVRSELLWLWFPLLLAAFCLRALKGLSPRGRGRS